MNDNLSPDDIRKAVDLLMMEAFVEEYHALNAKIDAAIAKRDAVRYRINDLARTMKLPFHCPAGSVQQRTRRRGQPANARLIVRARVNGLARVKRVEVVAA